MDTWPPVYWCAADIGWITGHSYVVYGPLCNGTTSVLYEGTPDFPDKDRWWDKRDVSGRS
jgi:acetyl-CoA synthetase